MKKIVIILLSFLFLSSCTKPPVSTSDESTLKELPSFEYAGYRYYIHPHLAIRTIPGYGRSVDYYKSEVESLDSYGFQEWFIPTIRELEEAANNGQLPKLENIFFASSDYVYIKYDLQNGWTIARYDMIGAEVTAFPMIKFRIL